MEQILYDILCALREGSASPKTVENIIRQHNKGLGQAHHTYAKKNLMPYYRNLKETHAAILEDWNITPEEDRELSNLLRIKPRRTASGVATITVITKPFPCSGNCIFCPNDIRMPKSYMHNEPACQRAERNFFDPYMQVTARLRTLQEMGHATDKVELIVLGGTFSDYPQAYQIWFITRLFAALNEAGTATLTCSKLQKNYEARGLVNDDDALRLLTQNIQARIQNGELSYNDAYAHHYGTSTIWQNFAKDQTATLDNLANEQTINETAEHRVVGLVVETRPNSVNQASLTLLRALGCTKVQIGIQSVNSEVLAKNARLIDRASIARACELIRLFGFKSHTHFMVNLLGQTPETDKADFVDFVSSPEFCPDEIKLYPVALMPGTKLIEQYNNGSWAPYDNETLIDILTSDLLATPTHTRISRMIRDFSSPDIQAGNKMTNLRQLVEENANKRADKFGASINEMRFREINNEVPEMASLHLENVSYSTSNTVEHFLQWITSDNKLAGFLRLSLPYQNALDILEGEHPLRRNTAMIREVHVYGQVAGFHQQNEVTELNGAQHRGLGTTLIERACAIAQEEGYEHISVISSIGTRSYYRKFGFVLDGLYQTKALTQ